MKINLDHIEQGLHISIKAVTSGTLFIKEDAKEHHEAKYQLVEGCYYQYKFNKSNFRLVLSNIIEESKFESNIGRISPNFYVGTLSIPILKDNKKKGALKLEVQSVKTSYRKDYRFMLESITNYAADLILQTNSPVNQTLEVDYETESKTLYQQFCFVKSIIDTEEFDIAIQQIITAPVTTWKTNFEQRDVRSLKKMSGKDLKQLIHAQNRILLLENHPLRNFGIKSIATKISTSIKKEHVDTPENRFIKHVLNTFLFFCEEIKLKSEENSRLFEEADTISDKLESFLQMSLFKEVSRPNSLKLNSPVLQKKTGYREILKTWLMYDLSAKLIWEGGEDVYGAGSKHVAKLYEYWLFFVLLDAIKQTFNIESVEYEKLVKPTKNTLGLQLKEGKQTAIKGTYISKERALSIVFSYNKTFSGHSELSQEGSWTLEMNPDYTLSIWPKEISEEKAEKTEQIVHIHFDSKYKVKDKVENKGIKRDDYIKMHAYKDAIRRTAGAYILYPGTDTKPKTYKGFHEILPGLGAFAIRPSQDNSGIEYLIDFITQVKNHFLNRATQRENIATKTYKITANGKDKTLYEAFPEYFNNEKLIPKDTYVLVGYYNSTEQYNWIETNNKYNFRMDSKRGSLILDKETVSAKYLLLHKKGDHFSNDLWRIISKGPKVYSKAQIIKEGYINPKQDYYLIIQIEKVLDLSEFNNEKWNFKALKNYKQGRASAIPFTTSLNELLANKI